MLFGGRISGGNRLLDGGVRRRFYLGSLGRRTRGGNRIRGGGLGVFRFCCNRGVGSLSIRLRFRAHFL